MLSFTEPINSNTAAAGDSISARVVHNVTAKGRKEVLIPAGSMVRGRITDMRIWILPYRHFILSITWETVDVRGVVSPFSAKLDRMAESQKAGLPGRPRGRGSEVLLPPPSWRVDKASLLFLMTGSGYEVEKGFSSFWLTTAADPKTN